MARHCKIQVVLMLLALLPAIADADWPGYQGGNDHTGFVDEATHITTGTPIWSYTGVLAYQGIAVAGDKVFAATDGHLNAMPFVALDLRTGAESWRIDFANIFSVNAPVVDSGVVYFATGNHSSDTYMRAYDADTGAFLWRSNFEAQWEDYLAPIVLDGRVIFNGGYYGGIYALDQVDGSHHFWRGLPQYDMWSPVPWGTDRLIAYTNRLDILDRASGNIVHTMQIPDHYWFGYDVMQSPVIVGNVAYLTNGGRLIAIDLVARQVLFQRTINAQGQVSTDGTRLYLIASGALSVRSLTGDLLFSVEVPGASMQAPFAVSRTHAFVPTNDATTAMIDLATRQVVHQFPGQGKVAISNGTLVIAANTGEIRAFDVRPPLFANGFED